MKQTDRSHRGEMWGGLGEINQRHYPMDIDNNVNKARWGLWTGAKWGEMGYL